MESKTVATDYLLTAKDRCDACNAQAYVYVAFESGDLLFCLHHWKAHSEAAKATLTELVDETERLLIR
jgi:hypothetical protein